MTAPRELGTPVQQQVYSLIEAIGYLSTATTPEEVLTKMRSAANKLMSAEGIVIIRRSGDDYHCVAEDASVPHWVGNKIDISEHGYVTLHGGIRGKSISGEALRISGTEMRYKLTMRLAPSETGFAIAAYWHPRRTPTEFELKVASALDMAGRAALRRLKSGAEITELKELIESIRLSHRELAHRLKNAYASVIGVARLTLDADAADDLGARLKALSAVHDLLDRETGHPPDLVGLLTRVLSPYQRSQGDPIALEGEQVFLCSSDATVLGIVMNELATNALKHGALSIRTGHVQVGWLKTDNWLSVRWREYGTSCSSSPVAGDGSVLLRRLIEDRLGGRIEQEFNDDGIAIRVEFPVIE